MTEEERFKVFLSGFLFSFLFFLVLARSRVDPHSTLWRVPRKGCTHILLGRVLYILGLRDVVMIILLIIKCLHWASPREIILSPPTPCLFTRTHSGCSIQGTGTQQRGEHGVCMCAYVCVCVCVRNDLSTCVSPLCHWSPWKMGTVSLLSLCSHQGPGPQLLVKVHWSDARIGGLGVGSDESREVHCF